jgi:hypothetical protein
MSSITKVWDCLTKVANENGADKTDVAHQRKSTLNTDEKEFIKLLKQLPNTAWSSYQSWWILMCVIVQLFHDRDRAFFISTRFSQLSASYDQESLKKKFNFLWENKNQPGNKYGYSTLKNMILMFKQQELASRIVDLSGWDDGKDEYNTVETIQTLSDHSEEESEEDTSEEYLEMMDYKNSKV